MPNRPRLASSRPIQQARRRSRLPLPDECRAGYFFFIFMADSQAILPSAIFMSFAMYILPSEPIIIMTQASIGLASFIMASVMALSVCIMRAISPFGIIMTVSPFLIMVSAAKAGVAAAVAKPATARIMVHLRILSSNIDARRHFAAVEYCRTPMSVVLVN
ncbi:MAG: hypothetical protein P0Y66_20315 [Candidatus Kaistia colombiensis]|nr:MAG: hypothetical protein P0Y66_20315 [Kaistia sp.]